MSNTDKAYKAVDDAAHSATADKAKGRAKEAMGTIKEKIGSAIGDDKLKAEGKLQNAEGKKDRAKGEIKETIDDVKNKAKAGVEIIKEKFGKSHD